MLRLALKDRKVPFREIGNLMEPGLSASTVGKHLTDENYHRSVARTVPFLKPDQRRKRLAWARNHHNQDWEKVIWSDECYVYIGDTKWWVWVTHRPDEEWDEECLVPTFKQSSIRVMVCGCIMKGKKGPLVVLEYPGGKGGGMNVKRYQEQVLDGKLAAFFEDMKSERDVVLSQQDSTLSHTAKSMKKWFNTHGIPSSPNFNPIECVWCELKKRIRAKRHPPTSIDKLIAAVKEAWDSLPIEDVDKYIDQMGNIVEDVLRVKGGHTKY
ncbi:hypothetical protein D9758_003630 [Tetrapyrgos nigripes]|uniref:Transposase Tc1-like domain-containing protein n=1 Tax=Tetrapyrgos nigripes TaxID=182062 RepID=A0A8H5GLW5_9AGAR|nr:hypothetical protein D9758_003630 [Tetrapyrgos nigripes]